ncbi:MAG: DUF1015 domain-containing protein [Candidatus Omnitrophica bacterium]|nr:DUF1015 domain-containing protein [Candidatus Omnitrophota bacterium]
MTKIKPFKAIFYNREKIKNPSYVVCPPYDVISPAGQKYYHQLNPYNFIHILLGKDLPNENKYKRAGKLFRNWLKKKILIQEEKPAIYFYSHQYNLMGERKTRLGFIALLRLKDRNSAIFGHEHTHLEAKEDRLRLIKQVKANLSPIFVTFLDKKRIIQRVYNQYLQDKEPFLDLVDSEKNNHKLWRLQDRDVLERIEKEMKKENIFIADGHHRYEVACTFREQMKKRYKGAKQDKDYNYILAYFTNTDSRGLTILPVHRLLKFRALREFDSLRLRLKEYFFVEEIKDRMQFFFRMQRGGRTEHLLGMYGNKKYWLLRLKNIKIPDMIIKEKSKDYRSLDVAILNHIVLEEIFKIDLKNKKNLLFSPNADELIQKVDSDPNYLAFFLNPVKIQQIISVSLSGERMPPKSTYFYPKVLSGLVINRFKDS